MNKVKCVNCGDIGFTASPRFVKCPCGGRLKIIPFSKADLPSKGENRVVSFIQETEQQNITTTAKRRGRQHADTCDTAR
jgi:hypothetical protein